MPLAPQRPRPNSSGADGAPIKPKQSRLDVSISHSEILKAVKAAHKQGRAFGLGGCLYVTAYSKTGFPIGGFMGESLVEAIKSFAQHRDKGRAHIVSLTVKPYGSAAGSAAGNMERSFCLAIWKAKGDKR